MFFRPTWSEHQDNRQVKEKNELYGMIPSAMDQLRQRRFHLLATATDVKI